MNRIRHRLVIGLAALTLFLIPVAATGAISLWDDVPHDSIFVNDTNWMKVTGVSKGCNPPANTEYCPESLLTRQQMAAFLHRLSVSKIVDAATAVEAELAEYADDADQLDGLDSTEIMSHAEGVGVADVPAAPGDVSHNILSIESFDVPADGGILTVHGNLEAYIAPDDHGAVLTFAWLEIGGTGSCDTPIQNVGGGGFLLLRNGATPETTISIVDSSSALETLAVAAGTTRIDLCVGGVGDLTPTIGARLNGSWTPSGSAPIAGGTASSGITWQDVLAPYRDLFEG